jgi:hypothetical protein
VEKTSLERLVNARVLALRDAEAGVVLLHVLDGWAGANQPTEGIPFEGKPDWVSIRKADLLDVQDTTGNVSRDVAVHPLVAAGSLLRKRNWAGRAVLI